MTKEELFESHKYVVKVAIIQHFGNSQIAKRVAAVRGYTLEDLYQIGYLALWRALDNIQEGNIYKYSLIAVKCDIMEALDRRGSILKLPLNSNRTLQKNLVIKSMDQVYSDSYFDDYSLHDYLPSDVNVENYVIRKMELESKLNNLKEIDRKILIYKLNGWHDTEIAEKLGMKRHTLSTRRQRAMKKITG